MCTAAKGFATSLITFEFIQLSIYYVSKYLKLTYALPYLHDDQHSAALIGILMNADIFCENIIPFHFVLVILLEFCF